ncbi:hypothetical protein ABPE25_004380 [Salmonella enterica subsp. enterica serovar Newport]|nr:hypothetical protein [Salmonella enterica subsp. enterica serovar Newport]EDV5411224.1 hypothetical protein [Salmonella enterica subsp. enterica]EHK8785534.1 hypothetical protein [Salmonella enterica subsp. enterica serovar Bardo]ELC2954322.1 hypothetical protein [Salmonella enterica]EDD7183097.1 hypothetical protein [Salmonella enterica subsp. enterica serovar Newport]
MIQPLWWSGDISGAGVQSPAGISGHTHINSAEDIYRFAQISDVPVPRSLSPVQKGHDVPGTPQHDCPAREYQRHAFCDPQSLPEQLPYPF